MFKKILQTLWMTFVVLLFLAAAVLMTARLLVPYLSHYRVEIEDAASQVLQKQVSIGRLEASWRGLNPVLKLKKVTLADPTGEQASLDIGEVWLTIDAGMYLRYQQLILAGIDVVAADLTLIRDAAGQLYFDKFRAATSDDGALQDLGHMARLSLHDVSLTWVDELHAEPPQRFSVTDLSLNNDGDMHTLTGHALLPADAGYRIDVEAELYGNSDQPLSWQGQLYVRGQSVAFSAVPARYLPDGMALEGIADIRLWADVAGLSVHAISGELDTRDLQISHVKAAREYHFNADELSGQFGWQQDQKGWQFALQQLAVRQGEHSWKTDNLSLAGRYHQQASHIHGISTRIVLDRLGALLPIVPGLLPEQRQLLAGLSPRGVIKDLVFNLSSEDGAIQLKHFSAQFSKFGIGEAGAFPMVSGLDGSISGDLTAGKVTLDCRNATIQDMDLVREALPLDLLQGDIQWLLQEEHVEVGSAELALVNEDLALSAKFAVDIPLAADAVAAINLDLAVETADVGRVHAYLPAGVMSPTAVAWLDRSLKSGVVTNGHVFINGRFDQLPFDNGEGRLEVRLPVTDAVLDFDPGWSPLTGVDAQVDFTGRSMDIRGHKAAMRTASLENIHVQILDLAKPVLTIKGDAQGALPVMLAELGSSTLGVTYGGFVDSVTTSGDARLGLDITLPLSHAQGSLAVAGTIALEDNTLQVNDTEFALQQISGHLDFDARGIRGEKLQGKLFGHPAVARVWTDAGVTNIRLSGPFDVLDRYVGKGNALGAAISGNSSWQVLVAVHGMPGRGQQAHVDVSVTSNLVGTRIDLPAPFGKDRDATRNLSINVDNAVMPVKTLRIAYGEVLAGLLNIETGKQGFRLQQGAITTGGAAPVLPGEGMLLVSGELKRLHVSEWQPHLSDGTRANSNAAPGLPVKLTLHLDELEVQGYLLDDVSVVVESAGRNWNIRATGPAASGDVRLSTGRAGLDEVAMNLDQLVLRSAEQPPSGAASTATPADFPDLEVMVKKLVFNKARLGRLEMHARKQPGNQYLVEKITLSSKLLDMQMSGSWRLDAGRQLSAVELKVNKGKMDRLMTLFGYQKSIQDGELSGTLRAGWPGALWDFSPPVVEGTLSISIVDGQLLDVEPGAAGRVLGLTSLSKLPRRLLLDFSDLYEEGFSFDKIKGSFTLDSGNAYTNDLYVDGPAAKIEIAGRIGLADQDYDELVTVTPYMKTGLSLAGALAAGPAVGAAVIVAETLLEGKLGPFSKIGQKQYSITGPWTDPVIKKLGAAVEETAPQGNKEFEWTE
jgi:uncharacterized protein (TIGR02099 family)